jgi:hypothetical protein
MGPPGPVHFYTLICKSADSGPQTKDSKLNDSKGISGLFNMAYLQYRGANKPLARPERKQATETEPFELHISYL